MSVFLRIVGGLAGVFLMMTSVQGEQNSTPSDGSTDSSMVIPGGTQGAELPSLTVTGENQIQIEFDRPSLELELDPTSAPGLEWGDPMAALLRDHIDLEKPFLSQSAKAEILFLADPWARGFRTGAVARFQPELEGVAGWRLVIANSRSDTVAVFSGKDEPPDEIEWDGKTQDGSFASPDLVYSYSLEALDRAGNRRTFVGPGFELPAYRGEKEDTDLLLFTGEHLPGDWMQRAPAGAPALLLEAVSLANWRVPENVPIEVHVAAPTFAQAESIAGSIASILAERLLGDPRRVRPIARAEAGASPKGDIAIVLPHSAEL